MHRLLLKNIGKLVSVYESPPTTLAGQALDTLPTLEAAWLAVDGGRIADYGEMSDFPGIADWKDLEVIDCTGKIVMPCFVDSHTHLVFSGDRIGEFEDRIRGLSYEDIAAKGGGILNSAARLRKAEEETLFQESLVRFNEITRQGTGAVEIKSGYGLDLESELKMLRVIRRLKELGRIPVKATFLGAHAVPPEFRNNKDGYVRHIITEMIPAIAAEKLADYIDIFCEQNYFDERDTLTVLEAGSKYGLGGRVHAEQLSHSGGIRAGVKAAAASVDHLEFCSQEDISLLKSSQTIPTILPGAAFFLSLQHPPARRMIDAGLPVAIASDYNPGSSPSGNMKLMCSIACIQYRLTPAEALNAATVNTAYSIRLHEEVGTITRGKLANLIVTHPMDSPAGLFYSFGTDSIEKVIINGQSIR